MDVIPNGPGWDRGRFGARADHVQTVIGIAGYIDVPAFQWAVDRVFRAHPRLLRGFGCDAAGLPISIQAGEAPRLREVDLRGCSAFEREGAALRLAEHERWEEFPLGAPPLIRLLVARLGEREQRLVVTSHRAVLDDWSHAALVRAMLDARGWDVAGVTRMRGSDDSGLVVDPGGGGGWSGGSAGTDANPVRLTCELPADLVRRVLDLAAEHGIDTETIVQGAWAVALSELIGRQDVLFGGVLCGSAGVVDIGAPREVLPILVSVRPEQSVIELLLEISARNSGMGPHRRLGLADAVDAVGRRASFGTVALLAPEPIAPVSPRLGVRIRTLSTFDVQPYALSFSVTPGARWTARLDYLAESLADCDAHGTLARAVAAIDAMAYVPGLALGRIRHFSAGRYAQYARDSARAA